MIEEEILKKVRGKDYKKNCKCKRCEEVRKAIRLSKERKVEVIKLVKDIKKKQGIYYNGETPLGRAFLLFHNITEEDLE
jgi:hypothetical protein